MLQHLAAFIISVAISLSGFAQTNSSKINSAKAHIQDIKTLAFTSDGKYLASGGKDKSVKVWAFPSMENKYVFNEHGGDVNALVFNADNSRLVSGSGDETSNVWDVATGNHLLNFGKTPYTGGGIQMGSDDISICDVDFSKDGQKILAVGGNTLSVKYEVRVYNAQSGTFLKALNIQNNLITSLDMHPDGKSFLTATSTLSTNAAVRLNELETGNLIKEYDSHLSQVNSVCFSKDAKYVVAATERKILLWDTQSGEKVATLLGHHEAVTSLAFSADGKYLASTSYDKKIIVWDFEEKEEFTSFNNESPALAVAFSPDGKYVVAGGEDGKINVWDFAAEVNAQSKKEKPAVAVGDMDILPRVRKESLSPFSNLKEAPELVLENGTHNDYVQSIKYTSDGKEIVTASWDKTIRVWDATNGKLIRTIHVPSYTGIEGQIYTMDISPDKKFIAVAGSSVGQQYDKQSINYIGDYVLLIDFKTGKILDVTTDHKQSIFSVAFSPDGKKLASCAGQIDNKVNIYSLDAVKGKLTFDESFSMTDLAHQFFPRCEYMLTDVCDHPVLGARFSTDSKEVMVVDAHGMLIQYTSKTPTKESSYKLMGESMGRKSAAITGKLSEKAIFRSIASDPKGRYVAAGDMNGKVLIFDSKGKAAVPGESSEILLATVPLKTNASVVALNFDPTGTLLGVAIGGEIRIYEIKLEGATTPLSISTPLITFKDHIKSVLSVAFSPDGNYVVSSGGDKNISYVWEARTGKIKFKLGGEKYSNIVTRVGSHTTNPFLIGYGNDASEEQRFNHYGVISKAFDLKNLRVIETAKESDFATAESDNIKSQAPMPDFEGFSSDMISYLPLRGGDVLIGTRGELFLNNAGNLLTITGTRAYGMAKSKDEETFYVGQSDGQIKIYDTKTLKQIASLYIAANNEWILFTPDGYYTASKHGAKLVGWLINNGVRNSPNFYPFEQFDLRLNRPDIVLSRIGGLPKKRIDLLYKAYQKRLEKMGIEEKSLTGNLHAPVLEVDLTITEATQKLLTFKIKATDTESELERLNVYVNDVPLYGSKGFSLKAIPSKTVEKQIIAELTNGQNKIQVSVLNTDGVESFQETRYVNYRGPAVVPNLYILAIGVSDYSDNNFDLQYASKDAKDISELYEKQVGKFGSVKTMTILDAEATKEKIKAAKIFLKQARVDDEVILFAAGHGLLDDNLDFYFGTTDVDFNKPSVRGLKYDDLEGLLDEVPARKKIMLIDACHSGEVDKEAVQAVANPAAATETKGVKSRGFKNLTANDQGITNVFELMRMMFSDLQRGSGAMVISSASGAEFAFENEVWKNGVFTYSLIEGLKTGNANLNKDADVQVSELRDYVIKRVGELTKGKQTPTSRKENLEFDFKVW